MVYCYGLEEKLLYFISSMVTEYGFFNLTDKKNYPNIVEKKRMIKFYFLKSIIENDEGGKNILFCTKKDICAINPLTC